MSELEYFKSRTAELERAATSLVGELEDYYFEYGDSELETLNDLRRLLGLEPQKPKHAREG